MPLEIEYESYGKSRVRVSGIRRDGARHEFIELTCWITLTGDFDAAYSAADNSLVVPTDTQKNTVYALAGRHGIESCEAFARLLANHFLDRYAQVSGAVVRVEESLWGRMRFDGAEHNHAFLAEPGRNSCEVIAAKSEKNGAEPGGNELAQSCGLHGLKVLKTTGSAFTNYHTDELTTLQPTDDRVFATTIDAEWECPDPEADWQAIHREVRRQLLKVFAEQHSESVQHTIYGMAGAVLSACPEIQAISLTMPNQHHLLADLKPFGLENPNRVFVPTDEPFGNISATIGRGEGGTVA